jgi:hypothetical protein
MNTNYTIYKRFSIGLNTNTKRWEIWEGIRLCASAPDRDSGNLWIDLYWDHNEEKMAHQTGS